MRKKSEGHDTPVAEMTKRGVSKGLCVYRQDPARDAEQVYVYTNREEPWQHVDMGTVQPHKVEVHAWSGYSVLSKMKMTVKQAGDIIPILQAIVDEHANVEPDDPIEAGDTLMTTDMRKKSVAFGISNSDEVDNPEEEEVDESAPEVKELTLEQQILIDRANTVASLVFLRICRGLTRFDVATLMRIDESEIVKFEDGEKDVYMSFLQKYSRAVEGEFKVNFEDPR